MKGHLRASKKKMSRLKRIIVRERADKAVAVATQAAAQAAAAAAAAKQAHSDLVRDTQVRVADGCSTVWLLVDSTCGCWSIHCKSDEIYCILHKCTRFMLMAVPMSAQASTWQPNVTPQEFSI